MVGFGLEYACAHIIILAEISSENLLPIRADFVTERDKRGRPGFRAEFAHSQLHSAHARDITDRINGEGLGSEAIARALDTLAHTSSRIHWKCDGRVMTDRQTWTLLRVAC